MDKAPAQPAKLKLDTAVRKALLLSSLLLFIGLTVLVLTKPISQDEGVFLTIGKYLNHGLVPYRDFVDHKPPGIYFLFAGLFKVFGTSVWAIQAGLILSIFGTAILVKKITDRLRPGAGWLATALFLFLMTQFEGYYLIAEPFVLWPLLLALWFVLNDKSTVRPMFAAGALLAIVLLFKQTAALSALPLLVFALLQTRKRLMVILGFLTPLILVFLYLETNGVLAEAWYQVVTLSFTNYPPESIGTILRAWRWNFGWTLPVWILLILGPRVQIPNRKLIWLMIILPLPFMFVRHYAHYWIQILPFVAMVAAITLNNLRSRMLTLVVIIFCVAIAGGKVGRDAASNMRKLQEQFRVAKILRQLPATIVLAENQFTAFYFLLPQRPLNRFLYLTEITDAENAEQRTIDDLKLGRNVLILWPVDPNFAYAKKLQDIVIENAPVEKKFSALGMRVMTYKPAPHPSPSP